jgi:hypothetical protein
VDTKLQAVPEKKMATGEQTLELSDLQKMLKGAWDSGYKLGYGHGFELGVAVTLGKGD